MDENVRITIENNFVIWPFCLKEELLQTNYMYIQSKKVKNQKSPISGFKPNGYNIISIIIKVYFYMANTCSALNIST